MEENSARPQVEVRDSGLLWYSFSPRYFKYKLDGQEWQCVSDLGRNMARLTPVCAALLGRDTRNALLIGRYNRIATCALGLGFIGGLFVSFYILLQIKSEPALWVANHYPEMGSLMIVVGLLCIGAMQLLIFDLHRLLKQMFAFYQEPSAEKPV